MMDDTSLLLHAVNIHFHSGAAYALKERNTIVLSELPGSGRSVTKTGL